MCSRIKNQEEIRRIGGSVFIRRADGTEEPAEWTGFARKERMSFWRSQGAAELVQIQADTFIEGKNEFNIEGKKMLGLRLTRNVYIQGRLIGSAGSVKVITRSAETDCEIQTHPRFPLITEGGRVVFFSEPNET